MVNNTEAMQYLLEALEVSFNVQGDKIVLECSKQDLAYLIATSDESIQHIYGSTQEWQDLLRMAL